MRIRTIAVLWTMVCLATGGAAGAQSRPVASQPADAWVEPMRKVHAKFTGQPGVVARFGDSITVSRAFFCGLQWEVRNLSPEAKEALTWLRGYVQPRCWGWEGASYGNDGGTTSAWGLKNMDDWLNKLNPEIALIMWGTNDTYQGPNSPQYTGNLRQIVQKCLDNGTIPILYTIPPVSSQAGNEKKTRHVESFVEAARLVAAEKKVPLIDYYAEMMKRQPADFAKTLMGDELHPSAPQKYSNDFSEEALKNHGYGLRNYLTLMKMYEVQQRVLSHAGTVRAAGPAVTPEH